MKKLIGLLVVCFVFSLSALAQHGGHEGGGTAGGRWRPSKHPEARSGESSHSASGEENRHFNDKEGAHPIR